MINIRECTGVGVGYLDIVYTAIIPVLFDISFNNGVNPRLAYENDIKDIWYQKLYSHSYTTH